MSVRRSRGHQSTAPTAVLIAARSSGPSATVSAPPSPAGTTHVAATVVTPSPSVESAKGSLGSTGVAIATAVRASAVALPVTYRASVRASSADAMAASAALGVYPSCAFSLSPTATFSSYVTSAAASAASASSIAVASACAARSGTSERRSGRPSR